MDLVIRNATIAGEPGVKDIGIRDGRIVKITERIDLQGAEEVHAQGYLVAPGFVNVHMHLDKALILDRYDWSGQDVEEETFIQTRREESDKVKKDFTVEDVRERAIVAAQMCAAHGTTTLRTHAEVDSVVGLTDVKGVLAAKEACRGFIEMQVDAYPAASFGELPTVEKLLRKALDLGADLVGGVPEVDIDGPAHVDRIFALAKEYDKDIDFHVDQPFAARPFILPYIADKTIAEGWQGRVLAGHCYALGHVTPKERRQAIAKCREAGISICCFPDTTIKERMVEPYSGGVNVTYMSDNIQDTWDPFGNGDMLLLAYMVGRLGPWRSNEELDRILDMGTIGAAQAIGLGEEHGVAVGKQADLVIFEAKSGHEAIINQVRKLHVIKRGRVVAQDGKLLMRPRGEV